ncbi:MAG: hypothetical protein IIW48_11660 [Clostridia bacterium]|nr:hypothetical protein [Clostridia bacterium]
MSKKKQPKDNNTDGKKKMSPRLKQATAMLSASCVLLVVAAVALSGLGFFHMIGGWFIPRGEVKVGVISEKNQIESLGDKQIVYRVNSDVVFEHTYAQGTIMLENPKVSKYDLQFSLYLPNNRVDPIYESPMLSPGECILSDKLTDTMRVKKGDYTCVCIVKAYDAQGNYCGQNTCTIIVTILDN